MTNKYLFIYGTEASPITMKSILFIWIMTTMAIGMAAVGFGLSLASAQMADNATMGNITGGNMTSGGNATEATGSISGTGNEDGFT